MRVRLCQSDNQGVVLFTKSTLNCCCYWQLLSVITPGKHNPRLCEVVYEHPAGFAGGVMLVLSSSGFGDEGHEHQTTSKARQVFIMNTNARDVLKWKQSLCWTQSARAGAAEGTASPHYDPPARLTGSAHTPWHAAGQGRPASAACQHTGMCPAPADRRHVQHDSTHTTHMISTRLPARWGHGC